LLPIDDGDLPLREATLAVEVAIFRPALLDEN
jgi:hypothetical protein